MARNWLLAAIVAVALVGWTAESSAQTYSCSGSSAYINADGQCSKERASNANTLPKIVDTASRQIVGIIGSRLDSFRASSAPGATASLTRPKTSGKAEYDIKDLEEKTVAQQDARFVGIGSNWKLDRNGRETKETDPNAKAPTTSFVEQAQTTAGKAPILEFGSGRGAGADGKRFGFWVSGQWTSFEDDNSSTAADGNLWAAMVGADYRITNWLVAGIAGGYENTDLDTSFNRGNINGDGYTVAPYLVFNLGKIFSLDVTGGYTWLEYDVERKTLDTNSNFTSTKSTGSFDGERWFGASNLNADWAINRWRLGASAGVLFASEKHDSFTESNGTRRDAVHADLGRASINGKLGYAFPYITPWVKGGFEYDFTRDDVRVGNGDTAAANDDSRFVVGVGLDLHMGSIVTGRIEGTTVLGDDDVSAYTVRAGLSLSF